MSGSHRHHRHSSRHPVSKLEIAIASVGLVLSVVAGVVAYQKVGLYGDGPFSYGYRHVTDPETGKTLLVHESHTPTGIVRRVIDGTTLKEVDLDVNAGGREHVRVRVEGSNIAIVERDQDRDGRIDTWEYYDTNKKLLKVGFALAGDGVLNAWAYRGSDGEIAKVEVSTRRDGVVDRWEYYEKGQLARVDEDTDHDGHVDRWSTYDGGILMDTATTFGGRRPPGPPAVR
jgi:hypothetical protein